MNTGSIVIFSLILAAAGAGFFRTKQLESAVLRFFPYFLLIQFGYQFVASVYSFVLTAHGSNHFIFNIFSLFNIVYFSLLFYDIIKSPAKRKVITVTAIFNIIFYLVNLTVIQGLYQLGNYSRTVMAVLIVVYCLMYFHQLIASDEIGMGNPARDATFWIVTALFFFYLCSTLTISLWNYLLLGNERHIGPLMMRIFAFLLYGMYLVGFILHRPKKPFRDQ